MVSEWAILIVKVSSDHAVRIRVGVASAAPPSQDRASRKCRIGHVSLSHCAPAGDCTIPTRGRARLQVIGILRQIVLQQGRDLERLVLVEPVGQNQFR